MSQERSMLSRPMVLNEASHHHLSRQLFCLVFCAIARMLAVLAKRHEFGKLMYYSFPCSNLPDFFSSWLIQSTDRLCHSKDARKVINIPDKKNSRHVTFLSS